VQDDRGEDDLDDEEDQGERDAPDQRLLTEVGEPVGEVADRVVLDQDPADATEPDQPGQRDGRPM
jgi:hypothetical protein